MDTFFQCVLPVYGCGWSIEMLRAEYLESVFSQSSLSFPKLIWVIREDVELQRIGAYSKVACALFRAKSRSNHLGDLRKVAWGGSFLIGQSEEISCRL